MVRLTLKRLLADLRFLKNNFKSFKRSNRFGNVNDEFIYIGPYAKRIAKRDSGFFTEFTLSKDGGFDVEPRSDLHLSIIDANGYAVPHITFKPHGPNGIAFHFGLKKQEDEFPYFWTTHDYRPTTVNRVEIEKQLEQLYQFVVEHIIVIRRDNYGNEIERYPFHPLGTVGRTYTTPQKRAAAEIKRKRSSTPGGARKKLAMSDITNTLSPNPRSPNPRSPYRRFS